MNLASEVDDVHAHMLNTGVLPIPKSQACPTLQPSPASNAKPSSSRPKPPPTYVPRVLVEDLVQTQSLISLTKQLINQLQGQHEGYPVVRGTASSSSEVVQFMCCCDHPVVRARMCNFAYESWPVVEPLCMIIQLFVHACFVFL